jgi:hypothetical protein
VFVISVVHTLAESTTLSEDAVAAVIVVYQASITVRMSECDEEEEDRDEALCGIVEST